MADQAQFESNTERPRPASPPAETGGEHAGSPFHVLKPGQGKHVRWGSAIGAGVLAVAGAAFIWSRIQVFASIEGNLYLRTLIPLVLFAAAAYAIFWLLGRHAKVVDFMIATEGEMKKVNWSSRKEVLGATKVVIVTVLALSVILAVVDFLFIFFFGTIGVLKINVMQELLKASSQG
jgi:preprotein translocase SecE subunit